MIYETMRWGVVSCIATLYDIIKTCHTTEYKHEGQDTARILGRVSGTFLFILCY